MTQADYTGEPYYRDDIVATRSWQAERYAQVDPYEQTGRYGMARTGSGQGQDFVTSLTNAAKENPIPAALITMGVLWMFLGGSKTSLFGENSVLSTAGKVGGLAYRGAEGVAHGIENTASATLSGVGRVASGTWDGVSRAASGVADFGSQMAGQAVDAARSVGSTLGNAAAGTAQRAGEMLSSAYDAAQQATGSVAQGAASMMSQATQTAGEFAGNVGQAASGAASDVGDRVSDMGGRASQAAWDASHAVRRTGEEWTGTLQQNLGDLFERQPLLLGAVGVAIGAALGAALPVSDLENRAMGETSDALKDQVQELVSQKAEQAVAAAERIANEAAAQGLTPSAATQAVRSVTEKVASVATAARDSIARQAEQKTR